MKRLFLFSALMLMTTFAMTQVKFLSTGQVSIGSTTICSSTAKLQVKDGQNNIVIAPNDGGTNIGGYIQGSDPARLDFWHPVAKWNKVKFKSYALASDSAFKTNITPIVNATPLLRQIRTYSYYFISDSLDAQSSLGETPPSSNNLGQRDYGVLAQEVQTILPELIDTAKGSMFVNYNAFIGILIAGFNEQQVLIENLQRVVASQELDLIELRRLQRTVSALAEAVAYCCNQHEDRSMSAPILPDNPVSSHETAILYQNTPNPFSSNTEISCYLPETATHATIFIYNLQGVELHNYPISQIGINTITVNASVLPAGMYFYTLVVNNEIIDTKRMILTK
jgi:hypothetical protein